VPQSKKSNGQSGDLSPYAIEFYPIYDKETRRYQEYRKAYRITEDKPNHRVNKSGDDERSIPDNIKSKISNAEAKRWSFTQLFNGVPINAEYAIVTDGRELGTKGPSDQKDNDNVKGCSHYRY
jgi:hypothetical protein